MSRRQTSPMPGCGPARPVKATSLAALVRDYEAQYRPKARAERKRFADMSSAEAVRTAALCVTAKGKRHDHQRRIPGRSLAEAARRLGHARLGNVRSFEVLHSLIAETCGDLDRFGELTRYDVAFRIGAHLGIEPERVYLHAGTRKGAKALGLPHRRATLEVHELPRAIGKLRPYEIEDFLCIYEEHLARFRGAR